MYGTTMKNYNANKAYKNKKANNVILKNKNTNKNKKEELNATRYMRINENKKKNLDLEATNTVPTVKNEFSRQEFPIASVVFTAIATMLALLIGTGILG